jgi:exodeoxyribonuclease VII large subunit
VQQRVDFLGARLPAALKGVTARQRVRLADLRIGTGVLTRSLRDGQRRVAEAEQSLAPALARTARESRRKLDAFSARLNLAQEGRLQRRRDRLAQVAPRLDPVARRGLGKSREDFARVAAGLGPELPLGRIARLRDTLAALDRLNESLSYKSALERGFAVVRAEGEVVTRAHAAAKATVLEIEFADGRITVGNKPAAPKKRASEPPPEQGSLL